MNKKFLLVAINSKYIHSNLAVHCLKNAAGQYRDNVEIAEYSINNHYEDIIKDIYVRKPDYIGFSSYIWNIECVSRIIPELKKLLPNVPIWLGGPEVSYNYIEYLTRLKITGIMKGEGEKIFGELITSYMEDKQKIDKIQGIVTYIDDKIVDNPCPKPMDFLEALPYDMSDYKDKIIYYESSRGCPFSCSYCLSSVDKKLRFKPLKIVKEDIRSFIESNVKLVKFIDRTFNARKEHAYEIIRYIKEMDKGITSFHFEISADILDEEGIELMNSLRPGLIQLEVGVQSTNPMTIKAIHRNMNLDLLRKNVKAIHKAGNIHMHLDLIAGLPYEDIESFKKSFNDIYAMEPHNLQLGFLKLLHGSPISGEKDLYGIVVSDTPPYEVLYTDYITYEDVILLKSVENVLEMFYNSGMFEASVKYMEQCHENAFSLYEKLGSFYDKRYSMGSLPGRNDRYRLLYDYAKTFLSQQELADFSELLKYDMLARDNLKSPPDFIVMNEEKNLMARRSYSDKKLTKAEHIEVFTVDISHYLNTGIIINGEFPMYFNYLERDVLTGNALNKIIEMEK